MITADIMFIISFYAIFPKSTCQSSFLLKLEKIYSLLEITYWNTGANVKKTNDKNGEKYRQETMDNYAEKQR